MELLNKRRLFGAFCILGVLGVIVISWVACDDFGLESDFLKGTIKGVIRLNAAPPDTTGDIRVALVKEFPPTNFAELLTSNNLHNKNDTTKKEFLPFEFQVPLEEFDAIVAVWKAKGTPWNIFRNVIGVYCNDNNELNKITLSDSQHVAEGIEFEVNLKKVDRTAKMTGQITFQGDWPTDIENMGLAVLNTENPTLSICIFPELEIVLLPKVPVDSLDYEIDIAPGLYAVLLVWQPVGAELLDFKLIGAAGLNTGIEVIEGETKSGVDIQADFGSTLIIQ
ncbi:MAG: hypothetical protein ACE5HS_18790 [bacterium]